MYLGLACFSLFERVTAGNMYGIFPASYQQLALFMGIQK
jgi:hypothetical protein